MLSAETAKVEQQQEFAPELYLEAAWLDINSSFGGIVEEIKIVTESKNGEVFRFICDANDCFYLLSNLEHPAIATQPKRSGRIPDYVVRAIAVSYWSGEEGDSVSGCPYDFVALKRGSEQLS